MKQNIITNNVQKKIDYFKERCFTYANLLNNKYEYHIFGWNKKKTEIRARWYANHENTQVTIYYVYDWICDDSVDFVEVDKVAFHEVYESTLAQLKNYMHNFYSDDLVNQLIHENVRLIENIFWPYIQDAKVEDLNK